MKAYRFDSFGSLDTLSLHDEPRPQPQRGELLLRVRAVALNYRDIAMVLGTYPVPSEPGHIPCSDASCEVAAVGDDVMIFKPGDRVIGLFHPRWFGGAMPSTLVGDSYGSGQDGWLAHYKVVPQEAVIALPEGFSWEEGATLPCAAATAWTALSGANPIRAGHTVLTQGTGGVSIFAVQLAKAVGARVIATTSSNGKAEALRKLGADEIVNYAEVPRWGERVRELTGGRGADRVVDVGGPSTIVESLGAVAAGGEIVLIGFLGPDTTGIDFFKLFGASAMIRPVGVGDRPNLESCVRAADMAGLKPVVDRIFAFDEAPAAFAHLQSGTHIGKIVISVQG